MKLTHCFNPIACLRIVLGASVLSLWSVLPVSAQSPDSENVTRPDTSHRFELAKQYYGECQDADDEQFEQIRPYLKAFTDMEVMADTLSDPTKLAQLMTVVNDPRTIHVMTKCATEPVMWDTWMSGLTDFNKMFRTMMRFMNPNIYMAWMMAPMNPGMYQPMMQFMNPMYMNRWLSALSNPTFYQPVTSLANPNWYLPRIQWMANPMSMQPILNMMHIGSPTATQPAEQAHEMTEPSDTQ